MATSRIIGRLISKLKKEPYEIKYDFSLSDLLNIIFPRLLSLIRGFFLRLRLNKSQGLVFKSFGSKVYFADKISCGRNFNLGRHSKITALCKEGVRVGHNFSLGDYAIIECTGVLRDVGEGLIIGDNVGINHYCFIGVRGRVRIGSNVIFGPRVSVFSENHNFDSLEMPIRNQGVTRKETSIEDDVWLGAGSSIMAGITIGRGSVIAAGSVVTKDVEPFSVVGGVPACMIKRRGV